MSQSKKKPDAHSSSDKVVHTYHDHANDVEEESALQSHLVELSLYRPADQNFTARLHRLLSCADKEGISHVISWMPHGRSFLVHDKEQFEKQVMPRWFQQSSMSSFLRQLNLYGFMRLHKGADKGGYYHELFLRGKSTLCRRIERTRIKGRGARKAVSHESEPDFYQMTPLPQEGGGAGSCHQSAAPSSVNLTNPHQSQLAAIEPVGGTPSAHQDASTIWQQLNFWQQQIGNDQSTLSLSTRSSIATLPHVNPCVITNHGAIESQAPLPPTSGPHPLPSNIHAVDSTSLLRASLNIPQPPSAVPSAPREFYAGPDAVHRNLDMNQMDVLSASLSQFAGLPPAHALATEMEQDLLPSQAPSSSTASAHQQGTHDPISPATLRNATLPSFLAGLFEPTPFPQLPSHPPIQSNRQSQLSQVETSILGGSQHQLTSPTSRPLVALPQHLQPRSPNLSDPNYQFSGIHPYLSGAQGLRMLSSRTTTAEEEGKETNWTYQESKQRDDQEGDTK